MTENLIVVKNAEAQSVPVRNDCPIYIVGRYSMRYAAGQQVIRLEGTIQTSAEDKVVCDPVTGVISFAEPAEFDAEEYGRSDAYKNFPYFMHNGECYYVLSRYIVGTGYTRMTSKKCVAVLA